MNHSTPGLRVHHYLPEFTQTHVPSSRWCHPAISSSVIPFSSCPQSPSIRVFSYESTLCMRWPKCWSFSFSIIPSKEIPGLIFRMMSFRIFPILVFLIYFSCLIELPRTFSKILDKGGVSRYSCLLSDPGGTYSPLHVEYDVNCRFWQMYSVLKKVPLHS